jgi:hypothetical protein
MNLNYSGVLTSVDTELTGQFSVGDPFNGFITYDTATPNDNSVPGQGRYFNAIISMSFVVPGKCNFAPTILGNIGVNNNRPSDLIQFNVGGTGSPVPQTFSNPGFLPVGEWRLTLSDLTGTALPNAELPTSLNSADFNNLTQGLEFYFLSPSEQFGPRIHSSQFVLSTGPAVNPLFGTGLGILGFLGWRRMRKAV